MINKIQIRNFRCFESLEVPACRRINILTGDNGVGKSALLEAIFLALGNTPHGAMAVRSIRGFSPTFAGTHRHIEESLWGDLFHAFDLDRPINIRLEGSGPESRALNIARTSFTEHTSFSDPDVSLRLPSSIEFTWTDSSGFQHGMRPQISATGLAIEASRELLPDFFMFSPSSPPGSIEIASRLSDLTRVKKEKLLLDLLKKQYPWIVGLQILVRAMSPAVFVETTDSNTLIPLGAVSSAINRIFAIYTAMVQRNDGVVLIDEIENGIYHKHHSELWRSLLSLSREYNTQLFITSHSLECLRAMRDAVTDEDMSEMMFGRVVRVDGRPIIRQFEGADLMAALEGDVEIR